MSAERDPQALTDAEQIAEVLAEHAWISHTGSLHDDDWVCMSARGVRQSCGFQFTASGTSGNPSSVASDGLREHQAAVLADRLSARPAATTDWCGTCHHYAPTCVEHDCDCAAAATTDTAAQAVRAVAEEIRASVSYGAGMNPDGTEDPGMAAYVEGIGDAYRIASDHADLVDPGTRTAHHDTGHHGEGA